MRRALSSCRLYSWMRLTWQSKIVSGSTVRPEVALSQSANRALASRLALRTSSRKPWSSASGLSFRSWPRSVIQPSPMASVIVRASAGLASSSQRRGVTPLVLLLKRSGNISAKSLTVTVRSSSEWMAATPLVLCEPTIARLAMRILRSAPSSMRLMRATRPSSPGKRARTSSSKRRLISKMISRWRGSISSNQRERPFLQGLGQQRVVRVGQRPLREVPGLVPAELRLVEQDAHQLGDGHGGVGVVELDGDLLGQRAPVGVAAPEAPHEIGQRAGDEEVLLHEAQPLALAGGVVGIEHARERFGGERLGEGADEVAAAERLEVEVVGRRRGPQPQRVDRLAAVADHRPIERDADQGRRPAGDRAQRPRRASRTRSRA